VAFQAPPRSAKETTNIDATGGGPPWLQGLVTTPCVAAASSAEWLRAYGGFVLAEHCCAAGSVQPPGEERAEARVRSSGS